MDKLHTACGGAGQEVIIPYHNLADIDRVECIHILFGIDRIDDGLFIKMLRQRKLAQNAVNFAVIVELLDQRKKLGFGGFGGKRIFPRGVADLGASLLFVVDVYAGSGVVTDDNHRKAGSLACFFEKLGCFKLQAFTDSRRYFLAVENITHSRFPPRLIPP